MSSACATRSRAGSRRTRSRCSARSSTWSPSCSPTRRARSSRAGSTTRASRCSRGTPPTGEPLTPVVVWQDKRAEEILAELGDDEAEIRRRSGLPLDPYFSAGKLAWLLRHDAAVAAARERGTLRMGTVDAFISDRLGAGFVTDASTASRTQLHELGSPGWDPWLLDRFGVPVDVLPAIGDSVGTLGVLSHERWPIELPLTARVCDQQAALAGSGCVVPGAVKATYGTGVFVLAHVGRRGAGCRRRPAADGRLADRRA